MCSVLVCTDAGIISARATRRRAALAEQQASAAIGRYEFELLRRPDGRPFVEACQTLRATSLLAALWQAIRESSRTTCFVRRCPRIRSLACIRTT